MDTYNPSELTAAPKKVDISLRQLADFDSTGGDRNRVDNVRDNQILVSLSKFNRPKTFSFHYISDILLGGTGVTISTDKDGITSITNTGVTKIIAGTNISISPVTGIGDVTITNTASSSLAINTTPITSGTVGRILFEGTGNVLQQSGSLFWDNTNSRLGIGTASPTTGLTVSKALTTTGNELLNITYTHSSYSSGQIQLGQYFNNTRINFIHGANNSAMYLGGANFTIETQNVGNFILSNGTERMRMVATTGNILIGTTTDAGYKLDVNGTARVSGTTTVQSLLVPTTNLYDLGTLGVRFRSGYFKGILIATEMYAEQFRFAATNYPILNLGGTQIAQYFGTGNLLIQTGGTFTDVASSLLTINSTTKGFLPPRMTTTEKNAIASPAAGLVVYDTNLGKLCVRGASAWETITSL